MPANDAIQTFITGIGAISPIGCEIPQILENILQKRDGIRRATKIDTSPFLSKLCAEFDFDYSQELSEAEMSEFRDPYLRLAISASRRALRDAGLKKSAGKNMAIVAATCNAGTNSQQIEYRNLFGDHSEPFTAQSSLESELYAATKALARALGLGGEIYLINTACSGSTAALGFAQTLIESGEYEAVLAGGADALSLVNFAGFSAIKVVSEEKTAPFSTPTGLNIGEGAAFWVLENSLAAKARGAKVYGKIAAHSTSSDAFHPTQPDPRGDGVFRTLQAALDYAQIPLEKIACINAHASGTLANDKAEAKGVLKFLNGKKIPITSSKSYNGHCMGATGILEATVQLVSMLNGFLPPTLRFNGARAGCEGLDVVKDIVSLDYGAFISSNYAFAGNNAAIVVAKESEPFNPHKFENCKIAITGLGAFCQIAKNSSELADAADSGKRYDLAPRRFYAARPELPKAAIIERLNPGKLDRRVDFSGMNPISMYATCAVKDALDCAGIKIARANCCGAALTACTSRGPSEEAHLNAVYQDESRKGDIACFSNITPNSTAGWVSKALEIKGANTTLTSAPNSSLQCLMYAAKILQNSEAKISVALAADEVYPQMLAGYSEIGKACSDADAADFKIRLQNKSETLYAEGASAVVLERESDALARGAKIYATILAASANSFCDDFLGENSDPAPLVDLLNSLLKKASLKPADIDLILLSPCGNSQDAKILAAKNALFKGVPAYTANFNTAFLESASPLTTLCACLKNLDLKRPLKMPENCGESLGGGLSKESPKRILAFTSSHVGLNSAVIFER